ncbi:nuclear transport factor 2 family protein [Amycolatopsis aidingensis]|uniref:nuclear transport factor 2 family protein n=1 Tax=Amycolatopsis aidingensis TaxID=2842453 RepID=UPI001E3E3AEA|nr:nuclear transport factor 2 family protein [Amycolatopsis aidingensis]
MTEQPTLPADSAGFVPTDEDIRGVLDWFAAYDAAATEGNVEVMADMAHFPINVVTNDGDGNGSAESWDRERFLARMGEMSGSGGEVAMESARTPVFLTKDLVFVVTDARITVGDHVTEVRYGDLLVRADGRWVFQTMVQGGWGAN